MGREFKLSIIILNFNTKALLKNCLLSIQKRLDEVEAQIIVVDNGSTDASCQMIKRYFPEVSLIENKENLGFAKGNNEAKDYCKGEYVLFLNSDTKLRKNTLKKVVKYLDEHKSIGALTCKILLLDGRLDKDARRSFITPWIGFIHIFLKLDRVFPKSKFLAKYWYGFMPEDEIHEVDAIQGAFFLTRRKVLDQVGWFDEEYFLDGEDIDLCWKIKKKGWKIIYYPLVSILHLKGASKGKNASLGGKKLRSVSFSEKLKYRMAGVNSMEIFIKKRLWNEYPLPLIIIVLIGVKALKFIRIIKVLISG
ncbi:hypothetical protein A2686_03150 [Candidatus Woesebacteria bacterium RIFCSPHIGHO2_01_FULL_38_10]|uniref:Glycosyltransferase 2-like domain-containing protein n=1 Tax=Candidatus Woesebacteria bacterium RIFCSPLOWO2_01_FULL_39_10b TaxID=1802517 RepID=A0A1F8B7A2_9BACT|nr:MAG: hypothetical protein A2686_03150 [Candidatus Woesebacteria bacterium RIFCSPHIGHO2_01_FULL_38_10]OGM59295.1 MAG: hypothetical protein A2892_05535 [Candidatus Woesebacteria bacterium RIFCSPLOWO2_01_FULL_39_10b]